MSKHVFDAEGERFYETGTKNGVLYPWDKTIPGYGKGVAWNGLTAVTESPEGAEVTTLWADDIPYLNLLSAETFKATIEAYMYPDEFGECDGSVSITPGVKIGQQKRKKFGFCYKTILGNDTEGNDLGCKYHLIYGCLAAPSERSYATVNDNPDVMTFSWAVSTTPVKVPGFKPTSCATIESSKLTSEQITKLENYLYGTDNTDPKLPLPDQIPGILAGTVNP